MYIVLQIRFCTDSLDNNRSQSQSSILWSLTREFQLLSTRATEFSPGHIPEREDINQFRKIRFSSFLSGIKSGTFSSSSASRQGTEVVRYILVLIRSVNIHQSMCVPLPGTGFVGRLKIRLALEHYPALEQDCQLFFSAARDKQSRTIKNTGFFLPDH